MEEIEIQVLKIVRQQQDKGLLEWHRGHSYRQDLSASLGDWEITIGKRQNAKSKKTEWFFELLLENEKSPETIVEEGLHRGGVRELYDYIDEEHKISMFQKYMGFSADVEIENS